MDEGKATLLAGIATLIGTLASAIAAWLAARFGARQGIETARAQVTAQRAADWEHWAREQRRQVLLDVLDRIATVDTTLRTARVKLNFGQRPGEALNDQYLEAHAALARNSMLLAVWGPDEARAVCQHVTVLATPVWDAWVRWEAAVIRGDATEANDEIFRSRRLAFMEKWEKLIEITKLALREPKEGGS